MQRVWRWDSDSAEVEPCALHVRTAEGRPLQEGLFGMVFLRVLELLPALEPGPCALRFELAHTCYAPERSVISSLVRPTPATDYRVARNPLVNSELKCVTCSDTIRHRKDCRSLLRDTCSRALKYL